MKELVTIILPVYNGEKYIEQMLNSIYLQDYRPIEVIISDDASKDKTVRIICTWLKNKCMNNIYFKVVKNKRNIGWKYFQSCKICSRKVFVFSRSG